MTLATKIIVWVLLLAAGAMGAAFVAWRVPDQPVTALLAKWAQPPSQFVGVRGMQAHVRDEGPRDDRVPILLLHGTGASLHTWEGWTRVLGRDHRVIRFDLPGFGLTGPSPERRLHDRELCRSGTRRGRCARRSALRHRWQFTRRLRRVGDGSTASGAGRAASSWSTPPVTRTSRTPSRSSFKIARTPVVNVAMRDVLPRNVIASSLRDVYGDPSKVTPELVDRYFDLATREGNRAALVARFDQTQPGLARGAGARNPGADVDPVGQAGIG